MSIEPKRLPDYHGVRLWLVQGPATEEELRACEALLSFDETQRLERYKVVDARDAFAVSRATLRRLLAEELGCAPTDIRLGRGKHGKPFVAAPGTDLEFNLSHSADVFLYGFTNTHALGVDVECHKEDREFDRLAERFFAPGEARRLLQEGRAEDLLENFYRCWTRKEAYLKAKGLGITMKLDAFEVTFLPGETPRLLHTEIMGEDPMGWRVREIEVPGGYTAALVLRD